MCAAQLLYWLAFCRLCVDDRSGELNLALSLCVVNGQAGHLAKCKDSAKPNLVKDFVYGWDEVPQLVLLPSAKVVLSGLFNSGANQLKPCSL